MLLRVTEPQTGFRIAFNMFDTDGNERVDKNEFLVIRRLMAGSIADLLLEYRDDKDTRHALMGLIAETALKGVTKTRHSPEVMENIFSHTWRDKRGLTPEGEGEEAKAAGAPQEQFVDDEQGLQRRHAVDTTLLLHFFGRRGKNELKYEGFRHLSRHLVHTVFQIFDEDGDGQLSYREFIAIMKDRLHRGFKSYAKNEGWEAFKSCVKQEMKSIL
ncbi:hypothetical protein B566_EDAN009420 [Ephemera danica]|nr:hypothetical protein B566_EDAN009420 [Ephemera danica]